MQMDVYVEPFPPTGARQKITQEERGANFPVRSLNGRQIFYRTNAGMGRPIALKTIDIVANPEFAFQKAQMLPIEGFHTVPFYREYDFTFDGTEFLMTIPADITSLSESEEHSINIVLNWFEELKERVPAD
jgi:hypothetical protein